MNAEAIKNKELQLQKDQLAWRKKEALLNVAGNIAGAALTGGASLGASAIGAAGRRAAAETKARSDREIAGIKFDMDRQYNYNQRLGGNNYGRR